MKKILLLAICIIFSLGIFNPMNVFAEENDTSIKVSDINAEAGTTVEVNVSINNNKGILGGTFKVNYDSDLSLKSANAGNTFSALTLTKPGVFENGCKFVWDATDINSQDIKDGVILTLLFDVSDKAINGKTYNVEVVCEDAIDVNLNPVNIKSSKGKISIVSSSDEKELDKISVTKNKVIYNVGDELTLDDLAVKAFFKDKSEMIVTNYLTNVSDIDMNTAGTKKLIVTYTYGTITKSDNIEITLKETDAINGTKVVVDSNVALPGDQMDINISIIDNPGILGMTLKLQYDTKLTLLSANTGEAFSALTLTKPGSFESGCTFVWDGTDLEQNDIKDGTILTLTFAVSDEAKVDEKYIISATCEDPVDKDLNPIKITSNSGSITVGDGNNVVDNELQSIEATKEKTSYNVGDQINVDDIVVTATYNGGVTKEVDDYTTNVSEISTDEEGTKTLVVSYTEDEVTCECEIQITISKPEEEIGLKSIDATKVKKTYYVGDQINVDDIVVTASYTNGETKEVETYTTNASSINMNEPGVVKLTISYSEDDITKTCEIEITVNKKDEQNPSDQPEVKPTDQPEVKPTDQPSETEPTKQPTPVKPTDQPTPTKPTNQPTAVKQTDKPTPANPTNQPVVDNKPTEIDGVGTIVADGSILIDLDGDEFFVAEKISNTNLKNNISVADKKSGGKYKITQIKKKGGKVVGGTVTYVKPYNKNCKKATIKATVKISGVSFKVTKIANNAFKKCKNITQVKIGKNVTHIGKNAFYGCKKLKTVNIKANKLKKIGGKAFKGINAKPTFKLPKSKLNKYEKLIKKAGAPKKAKYK